MTWRCQFDPTTMVWDSASAFPLPKVSSIRAGCIIPFPFNFKKCAPLRDYISFFLLCNIFLLEKQSHLFQKQLRRGSHCWRTAMKARSWLQFTKLVSNWKYFVNSPRSETCYMHNIWYRIQITTQYIYNSVHAIAFMYNPRTQRVMLHVVTSTGSYSSIQWLRWTICALQRSPALIRVSNRYFCMCQFSPNSLSSAAIPLPNFPLGGTTVLNLI
jgi:hypothetical protein